MGLLIRCSKCNYTFYYSHSIKSVNTLLNLLPKYCPRCKKEIVKSVGMLKIKIVPKEA